MLASKAYFRLLIAIVIYSSRMLFYVSMGRPAILFLSTILLFLWAIYPIIIGNKINFRYPFQGDSNAQRMLIFFVIWQLIVIIRGVFFNYGLSVDFLNQLNNSYGIFALLLPLIVFLNPKYFNFKHLVIILTLVVFFFIFYIWYNRDYLFSPDYYTMTRSMITSDSREEVFLWTSSIQYVNRLFQMAGFLMFLPTFIRKKHYWFVIICWGIAFLCTTMGGRRGASLNLLLMALISFYFYTYKGGKTAIWLKYAALLFVAVAIAFYVYSSYSNMFSIMTDRIDADSRTEVYYAFWADMGRGFDWIWGRGLGGMYYCPIFQNDGTYVYYRNGIEAGFLNIILQGGVISLFLYVYVLLKALIKGFFHTKNQLTKAFAAYIGVSLFNLIPFGVPECSITFFVVWVGVAICGSSYYRNMTDGEIKQLFK